MIYKPINFNKNFCKVSTHESLKNILHADSFNLVALSGIGITFFITHLDSKSKDTFVYINTYEMPEFTKQAFYRQMIIKLGGSYQQDSHDDIQHIKELLEKKAKVSKRKIIIIFNRFDRLAKICDQSFFDNLRFLRNIDRGKIVMVFVSSRPIIEEFRHTKDLLDLFSITTYFKPYSQSDLKEILISDGTAVIEQSAVVLSGGHHNLYNVLSRCQSLDNALSDSMVELLIKDLYFSLSRKQRDDLDAVARNKKSIPDSFLISSGILRKSEKSFETFTPLLSEYIIEQTEAKLPYMENKLFHLLLKNEANVVRKEVIFDTLWQKKDGIASEWALNSLVYRLRNHAGFDTKRYSIKSHKKLGYILYDSFKDL